MNILTEEIEIIDNEPELVSSDEFLENVGEIDIDLNENCNHSQVDENGVCINCLTECKIFSEDNEIRFYKENDSKNTIDPSRCVIQTKKDKGIKPELEQKQFPSEIINLANDKYLSATKGKTLRSNVRKGLMFASVMDAYKQLGGKQPLSQEIMEILEIERKVASKGIKEYALNKPKIFEKPSYITVEDYIPKILKKYNSEDKHISTILELYKKIKNRSIQIKRANAQSVACALIYCYSNLLGKNLKCKTFAKSVGISEITIVKLHKEISDMLSVTRN